jgi:hypothetical protein
VSTPEVVNTTIWSLGRLCSLFARVQILAFHLNIAVVCALHRDTHFVLHFVGYPPPPPPSPSLHARAHSPPPPPPPPLLTTTTTADGTHSYPMAPAPNGDHSLGMDGLNAFLGYGPMLRALAHRDWVLDPHAIDARDTDGNKLHANLFEVPRATTLCVSQKPHGCEYDGDANSTIYIAVVVVPSTIPAPSPSLSATITFGTPKSRFESMQPGRTAAWTDAGQGDDGGTRLKLTMQSTIVMVRMIAVTNGRAL